MRLQKNSSATKTWTDKENIHGTREEARSDIFYCIDMSHNSKRRHGSIDKIPTTEYEKQYHQLPESVLIIHDN